LAPAVTRNPVVSHQWQFKKKILAGGNSKKYPAPQTSHDRTRENLEINFYLKNLNNIGAIFLPSSGLLS
jgi:hypothetical protein